MRATGAQEKILGPPPLCSSYCCSLSSHLSSHAPYVPPYAGVERRGCWTEGRIKAHPKARSKSHPYQPCILSPVCPRNLPPFPLSPLVAAAEGRSRFLQNPEFQNRVSETRPAQKLFGRSLFRFWNFAFAAEGCSSCNPNPFRSSKFEYEESVLSITDPSCLLVHVHVFRQRLLLQQLLLQQPLLQQQLQQQQQQQQLQQPTSFPPPPGLPPKPIAPWSPKKRKGHTTRAWAARSLCCSLCS